MGNFQNYNFKILLLGDGNVGKTTLRNQYMGKSLDQEYLMTMGTEFSSKSITLHQNQVKFQIWDVAGQKLFRKIRTKYYQRTSGILLLFDLTDKETFNNIPVWIKEYLDATSNQMVPIIIIGNKVDLVEERRVINQEKVSEKIYELIDWIKKISSDNDVAYLETSALCDVNVRLAFEKLGKFMLAKRLNTTFTS